MSAKSFFRGVYPMSPGWCVYMTIKGKRAYGGLYYSDVIAAVFANDLYKQRPGVPLNEIPPHIEHVARQLPSRRRKHATKAEKRVLQAHAAQVDRLYLEWLLVQQAEQYGR